MIHSSLVNCEITYLIRNIEREEGASTVTQKNSYNKREGLKQRKIKEASRMLRKYEGDRHREKGK
jgi:hypothetical protein